jgi:hypothetical protein
MSDPIRRTAGNREVTGRRGRARRRHRYQDGGHDQPELRTVMRRLSRADRRLQQRPPPKSPAPNDEGGRGDLHPSSRVARQRRAVRSQRSETLVPLVARRTFRPSLAERVIVTIVWRIIVAFGRAIANSCRRLRTSFLAAWRRPPGRRKIIATTTGLLTVGLAASALDSITGIAETSNRSAPANIVLLALGAVAGVGVYRLLQSRDWPSSTGALAPTDNAKTDVDTHPSEPVD